jgi:hypothetical protein
MVISPEMQNIILVGQRGMALMTVRNKFKARRKRRSLPRDALGLDPSNHHVRYLMMCWLPLADGWLQYQTL